MKRRIDALISKHNIENYEAFIGVIRTNKAMYNEFINYLTINVSEFYRNPEQWETLKNEIIPMLLKNSRSLRIWSAACSTGDEPYTLVNIK
jgi:chemotaxis protein methyltransferase CheR